MDYAHSRRAEASFEEVTEAVERSIGDHGFDIVQTHDVHRTLEAKGFHIHPVRIYELRAPGLAVELEGSLSRGAAANAILLKVNVFSESGEIVVAAIKPSVMAELHAGAETVRIAGEAEKRMVAMIDDAVEPSRSEGP